MSLHWRSETSRGEGVIRDLGVRKLSEREREEG